MNKERDNWNDTEIKEQWLQKDNTKSEMNIFLIIGNSILPYVY